MEYKDCTLGKHKTNENKPRSNHKFHDNKLLTHINEYISVGQE